MGLLNFFKQWERWPIHCLSFSIFQKTVIFPSSDTIHSVSCMVKFYISLWVFKKHSKDSFGTSLPLWAFGKLRHHVFFASFCYDNELFFLPVNFFLYWLISQFLGDPGINLYLPFRKRKTWSFIFISRTQFFPCRKFKWIFFVSLQLSSFFLTCSLISLLTFLH